MINSRPQRRTNGVWRRRQCMGCNAVFTSVEQTSYDSSLAVRTNVSHIIPFQRDVLFLSIYDACRHLPTAVADAASLTDSVIAKLMRGQTVKNGVVERDDIALTAHKTVRAFNAAAGVHYAAYHAATTSKKLS